MVCFSSLHLLSCAHHRLGAALRELQTRTPAGQLRALAAALSSLQSNIAAERAKHQSMFVQGGTLTSEELLNRSCLQDLLLLGQVFASMGDASAAAFCLRTTSFVIHDDPFALRDVIRHDERAHL